MDSVREQMMKHENLELPTESKLAIISVLLVMGVVVMLILFEIVRMGLKPDTDYVVWAALIGVDIVLYVSVLQFLSYFKD